MEPAEIAYTHALRALDEQTKVLDAYRSRSTVALTATTVASGFLGAQVEEATLLLLPVVIAFAILVVSVVQVHLPRCWETALDAKTLVGGYVDAGATTASMLRDLALYERRMFERNVGRLETVRRWYTATLVALAAQVMCLILQVAVSK